MQTLFWTPVWSQAWPKSFVHLRKALTFALHHPSGFVDSNLDTTDAVGRNVASALLQEGSCSDLMRLEGKVWGPVDVADAQLPHVGSKQLYEFERQ